MQNKASVKWLYDNSKHIFFRLFILTILGMLISTISVRLAITSRDLIDVWTKQVEGDFREKIIYLAAIIIIQLLTQISFSTLSVRISGRLNIHLKKSLFNKLLKKDWMSISDYHSGELLNRLNSDLGIVTNGIVSIIPNAVSFLTRIALSFVTLYFLDPVFAMICLAAGPFIMIFARIYSKRMKGLHKKCQESEGRVKSFMLESLQNLLVIKSFKNEELITDHSTKLQNINFNYSIKRNNIRILANIMFYFALTFGYYFALAWCAYKISKGLMTFGTLTAILQLVGQIQVPFKNLSETVPQYYSMIASAERVIELETMPDEKCTKQEQNLDINTIYKNMEGIELKNILFSYDNELIFNNVDFFIEKGKFIVISGISGIGKSTLLKLLLGIISVQKGNIHILMKDKSKIPIDKQTRGLFAYVPQGNMILSGTIRENISFTNKEIDDKMIIEAAKAAEIWEDIVALPNGLDTVLGEKGMGLSEGQVQRIAIARAIFYDAPIILLDEATSALDEKTERAVLKNLKNLNTKTCIIVSHKKAAFDICEQSISIKNGKIYASMIQTK